MKSNHFHGYGIAETAYQNFKICTCYNYGKDDQVEKKLQGLVHKFLS